MIGMRNAFVLHQIFQALNEIQRMMPLGQLEDDLLSALEGNAGDIAALEYKFKQWADDVAGQGGKRLPRALRRLSAALERYRVEVLP